MDLSYQVMVYDSTAEAYHHFMQSLPALFESFDTTDEYLSSELLKKMENHCRDTFFCGEMIPAYEEGMSPIFSNITHNMNQHYNFIP